MNANLKRLVSRQDEIIEEVVDRVPKDILVVANIDMNLKVKLNEKQSPLRIFFSYPNNHSQQNILNVYTSHTNKMPSKSNYIAEYTNPQCIVVAGVKSK